jgi:hypothetical protein
MAKNDRMGQYIAIFGTLKPTSLYQATIFIYLFTLPSLHACSNLGARRGVNEEDGANQVAKLISSSRKWRALDHQSAPLIKR